MLQVEKQKEDYIPPKSNKHVILSCSNCRRKLVDIWVKRPDEKLGDKAMVWKMRANCCFCGDNSHVAEITGGFGYMPYADEDTELTKLGIENVEPIGDTYYFKTKKVE